MIVPLLRLSRSSQTQLGENVKESCDRQFPFSHLHAQPAPPSQPNETRLPAQVVAARLAHVAVAVHKIGFDDNVVALRQARQGHWSGHSRGCFRRRQGLGKPVHRELVLGRFTCGPLVVGGAHGPEHGRSGRKGRI